MTIDQKMNLVKHVGASGDRTRSLAVIEMTHDGQAIISKHGNGPDFVLLASLFNHQVLVDMTQMKPMPARNFLDGLPKK